MAGCLELSGCPSVPSVTKFCSSFLSPKPRALRQFVSFLVPLLHGCPVLASAWYRVTPPTLSCLETQHVRRWVEQAEGVWAI
jgi:hypothetical protein